MECAIIFFEDHKIIIPFEEMGFRNPDNINMRSLVGAEIDFLIRGVDAEEAGLPMAVASRKLAMTRQQRLLKRRNIREGSIVRARVVGVGRNTAIVEAYGIETIVPTEEIEWGHVSRVGEYVQTGEEHYAYVKSIDVEAGEIGLSFRLAKEDPFEMALNKYKVNGEYKAEITGIKPFGIFVGFEQGVQGLCPIPNWMNFSPGLGYTVLVTISRINTDRRQINCRLLRIIRRA